LHGFGERFGTGRDDEEFLEGEYVSSVFSTIDDIEARNGEGFGNWVPSNLGIMLPEWNGSRRRSSLSNSEGN
jgi:hypothetical protein